MPAPKVKADFDQLNQIASTFGQLTDSVKETTRNVQSRVQTLQNGDWVGNSANTFYAEMQDVVLPAMQRLSDALQEAGRVTINIRQVMEQAERDVAGVFAATPEAAPKADDGGILGAIGNAIGDFVSGVFEEGKGMVEGIVNMVAHPIQTLEGLAFAVTHPDKLWDALTKPYVDDWNSGHPWKAIGRGALNVALLIGTAGIGEAGAAAGEGANAVGKVGELAGVASKMGETTEISLAISRSGNVLAKIGKAEIIEELASGTVQSQKIAQALENGAMKFNMLGENMFEKAFQYYGGGSAIGVDAFAVNDRIFLRSASSNILRDTVHEGTHALDYLNKFVGSEGLLEKRAYYFERQFQIFKGMTPDFDNLNEIAQHIKRYYGNRWIDWSKP